MTGGSGDHVSRMAVIAELGALAAEGRVRRRRDGKWVAVATSVPLPEGPSRQEHVVTQGEILTAVRFQRKEDAVEPTTFGETSTGEIAPAALLRYYRSALRADPRGSLTESFDRHGQLWQLICGRGALTPRDGASVRLRIEADALAPDFRKALLGREAAENALAIGWPLAVGKHQGVPVVRPVGLIAARWRLGQGALELEVAADDILVNPDWVKSAAKLTSWKAADLHDVFRVADEAGLEAAHFLERLGHAVAGEIREPITGESLSATISVDASGIYNAAAIFLPVDSSFNTGAVRDLDAIAGWSPEQLSETALAPLLGLPAMGRAAEPPAINVGPLNAEQIAAVRSAMSAPLTVVTGPPGTGKSQAIVSMAASVLLAGGSVIVASKNHQALDAVEERLGNLAPGVDFVVRALKPDSDVDRSFSSVLTELTRSDVGRPRGDEEPLFEALAALAQARNRALDLHQERQELEFAVADLLDRIEMRKAHPAPASASRRADPPEPQGLLGRLRAVFRRLTGSPDILLATHDPLARLEKELASKRAQKESLPELPDVVALTDQVGDLAARLAPSALRARATLTPEQREELDEAKAALEFSGGRARIPREVAQAVMQARPLWLVSVLGAPRRLPLEPGLFDLVVFDEASQCDIASALPLFARARRAVVVGDSQQLNFIPQLGQAQDRNLMQAQGLPVDSMAGYAQSRRSLFDFAFRLAPHQNRILLRHQYRSAAPITQYISEEFYGSELVAAYDPARLVVPAGQKAGLAWTHVPGPVAMEPNNVNRAEVNAIVAHVERLLMVEGYAGTIGVTSPFLGQVNALQQAISSRIPSHRLEAADFRVATIDGFQGQERDLILFSPVLTARASQSAVAFVQKDHRRLNVAISRARAIAHVFGDLDYARSGKVRALQKLAATATEGRGRSSPGAFDSQWERSVYHALVAAGLEPHPQYEIAGRRLDFALFGAGGVKLDLEVDGRHWHQTSDGRRKQADIWRDHQLKSLGWRVRRFWVDELARDMEACIELVKRDLS